MGIPTPPVAENRGRALTPARAKRWVLAGLAGLCFGLGWLGLFVPGLPTTIFWILAVWLAGKSCPVIQQWVYRRGKPGELVRMIVQDRALPARAKHQAVAGLWVSLVLSGLMLSFTSTPMVWVLAVLPAVGLGVTLIIHRGLRTAEPTSRGD